MKRAGSPTILANILKEKRRDRSLSQLEVGRLVGVRQATISKLENNPGTTRLDTLFRALSALGIDLYLKDRDSDQKTSKWNEEW